MQPEINKYLTEAMGILVCPDDCGCTDCCCGTSVHESNLPTYFTWEGFGKLWEWAEQQEWWYELKGHCNGTYQECFMTCEEARDWEDQYINPTHFANAVYEYLSVTTKE